MSRSSEVAIRDLGAQLAVQRAATTHYQKAFRRALDNLKLIGREDIAKSIEAEFNDMRDVVDPSPVVLNAMRSPQPALEADDDDLF